MNSHLAELRRTSTFFALAAVAALSLTAPSQASVISETEPSGTANFNDTSTTSQSLDGLFTDQSSNLNIFPNDINDFSAPIFSSVTINGRTSSAASSFDPDTQLSIPSVNDIDFFSFNGLAGSKVFLDIDNKGLNDPLGDSRLSLFDELGTLIALGDDSNDPGSNGGDALIATYTLPGTGRYFVAVTEYDTRPNAEQNANGVGTPLIRPDGITDENEGSGPLTGTLNDNVGVAGATPDDSFFLTDSDGTSGNYTLHVSLSGAPGEPAPVPEPGTMALMGVGLASLAAARRRKKNGDKEKL